ncbi:MAG: hypothetical protein PVI25_08595 [Gammaproteobacteria bacterium]|jgi:hypothetical protein
MKYLRESIIVVAASVLGISSSVAEDKVEDVLICATQESHACVLYEGCSELNPKEINGVDFMKINLKTMELTGRRYDGGYGTVKIDKKTLLPKLLLLQGVNAEPEELEDGLAFSIAIHVDTGRMAAAVSTTETVYSMMGSCHAL